MQMSKIGNHIYAKDGLMAIEFYKKTFDLEGEGNPWLDEDGILIHQNLLRNGELFLSVSDIKHLPNNIFAERLSAGICPAMLFCVYFFCEDDFRKTFNALSENAELCREIEFEGDDIVCEIIDQFGVFWHLRVPKNREASFIPR